jgi:hypothetical protein
MAHGLPMEAPAIVTIHLWQEERIYSAFVSMTSAAGSLPSTGVWRFSIGGRQRLMRPVALRMKFPPPHPGVPDERP